MSKLIPFGLMPGHWGLKGRTREIARAEYELEGLPLSLRLAEINYEPGAVRDRAILDARLRHGDISNYDYDKELAKIELEGTNLEIALVGIELKHNRLNQQAHDRQVADLKGEPWVAMPDINWDPSDPSKSYFELDYNEHFVTFLRNNNYKGTADEEVVERWLNDVCRSVAAELSEEDSSFVSPAPVNRKRQQKKKRSEYS
jgi:hypothetical protein